MRARRAAPTTAHGDDVDASREREAAARRVERDSGISVEYDADAAGFDDVESTFRLGQRVRHPKFGEGEVRGFTGTGTDLKLTVYFPSVGPKTIVARFVELI